jgi:hypothetical protein
MCELVFSIQEFLKIVPGLVIFPLSFYLAWKKLGTNVSVSITSGADRITPVRITRVNLSNFKDRPIAIYSIHAVINKEITYEIDRFEPPLILKALESLSLDTKPYSRLYLGADVYEPDLLHPSRVDIYLGLADRLIKCKMVDHSSFFPMKKLEAYRKAVKETKKFNGEVYDEHTAFAITYKEDGKKKTAFVHSSGLISRDWDFPFNIIPTSSMTDEEQLKAFLEKSEIGKFIGSFAVSDLRKR